MSRRTGSHGRAKMRLMSAWPRWRGFVLFVDYDVFGFMARVIFTRNIQRHVACPPGEVSGATVREVLDAVFVANPAARDYVLDEHGVLRKHMNVFVNGEIVRDRQALSDPVDAAA